MGEKVRVRLNRWRSGPIETEIERDSTGALPQVVVADGKAFKYSGGATKLAGYMPHYMEVTMYQAGTVMTPSGDELKVRS